MGLLKEFLILFHLATIAISLIYEGSIEDCTIVEIRSYLKMNCTKNGEVYYKCPHSNMLYNMTSEQCLTVRSTDVCTDDPGFYQVCGHVTCPEYQIQAEFPMLCGSYMCSEAIDPENERFHDHTGNSSIYHWGGYNVKYYLSCDNETSCNNTKIEEAKCPSNVTRCKYGQDSINGSDICDKECDCYLCEDEATCSGQEVDQYGIVCDNSIGVRLGYPNWNSLYIPPAMICDGTRDCHDGRDEENCTSSINCTSSEYLDHSTVRLKKENRCSVPNEFYLVCIDYRDQLNCSQNLDSPLLCKVDGYRTSVSKYALCRETSLCDDEIDKNCDAAEGGCVIHKHLFCDGREDCTDAGMDEAHSDCNTLTEKRCERKLSYNRTSDKPRIPLAWVMDGVEDCIGGIDENSTHWKTCGEEWRIRYIDKKNNCTEVFICSSEDEEYIEYANLCHRDSETCSKETIVCGESRDHKEIQTTANRHRNIVYIGHYLPGLADLQLQRGNHVTLDFISPDKPFGVPPLEVSLAPRQIDCRHVYGELYVYLSCLGGCDNTSVEVPCILNTVRHDSCHNTVKNRVYTLANNSYLTIARRKQGSYISDLFSCKNGYCITYDKVCNLVDDCGDNSDEVECKNHFNCSTQIIPLSSVDDGILDCDDFSDECLEEDGRKNSIIEYVVLSYSAWTLGILAIIFNMLALVGGLRKLPSLASPVKATNAALILVICFGDLLMGFYLVFIAIQDSVMGESYCGEKYQWLTSTYCWVLGVISTLGSQISLFSMTCLSIYRFFCITRPTGRPTFTNVTKFFIALMVTTIFLLSIAIAVVPLIPYFEDYFVNELYYKDVPLFTGAPSKPKHISILEKYHSKFRQSSHLKWSYIRRLVQEMFSQDYGGVRGKSMHFYSNSGVCLFKFFISPDDPQQLFTMSVLLANFVCFVIICVCYASIYIHAQRSSERAAAPLSKEAEKRRGSVNSASRMGTLQRKVAAIIITDFLCWVPFIIVCVLHYVEIVSATKRFMYAFFSIVVLPINSVINPMLYDTTAVFGIFIETYWITRRAIARFTGTRLNDRIPGTVAVTPQATAQQTPGSAAIELTEIRSGVEPDSRNRTANYVPITCNNNV